MTHKETDKETDIATYRLNRPKGRFSENTQTNHANGDIANYKLNWQMANSVTTLKNLIDNFLKDVLKNLTGFSLYLGLGASDLGLRGLHALSRN